MVFEGCWFRSKLKTYGADPLDVGSNPLHDRGVQCFGRTVKGLSCAWTNSMVSKNKTVHGVVVGFIFRTIPAHL